MFAGRARDLDDVKGILTRHPEADLADVRDALREFEVLLNKPLVSIFENLLQKG
jgi:hypothetical protein